MELFSLYASIALKDNQFQKDMDAATESGKKFSIGIGSIIKTVVGLKVVQSAWNAIAGSMDAAVKRYDTLNKFPRVLESMGFSAKQAAAATEQLSKGIEGLPTTLSDITETAQSLAILTGDLQKATDTTLALNNAFMASGASAADASRGMMQYTQMLSKGSVDIMSWRTLQETMGYALRQTAEAFGFAGQAATTELYAALQKGEITFDAFNNKLIELSEATGGFADMAKAASGGIATAWGYVQNAVTKGTAGIIESVDNAAEKWGGIEGIILQFKDFVVDAFTTGAKWVGAFADIAVPAVMFFTDNLSILIPVLITAGALFGGYNVITSWANAITVAKKAIEGATFAQELLNSITAKNTATQALANAMALKSVASEKVRIAAKKAGLVVDSEGVLVTSAGTIATEAEAAAVLKSAGTISTKTAILGGGVAMKIADTKASIAATVAIIKETASNVASTAAQKLKARATAISTAATASGTIATKAANIAMAIFNGTILANPLFLLIAALTAVTVATIAFAKHLYENDEAMRQLEESTQSAIDANNALAESHAETAASYQSNINEVEANAGALDVMTDKLFDLIGVTNKTAAEEAQLKQIISEMNKEMPGLNLVYDENTGQLNKNEAAIRALVKAQKDQLIQQAKQARAMELATELVEQEMALKRLQEEYANWEQQLADGEIGQRTFGQGTADLSREIEEAEENLADLTDRLDDYLDATGEAAAASQATAEEIQAMADAYGVSAEEIQEYLDETGGSLNDWATAQEEAIAKHNENIASIADTILDVQKRIDTTITQSAQDMIDNLQHNLDAVEQWGDNLALLAERGLDEGYLQKLRDAGPESAAIVAAWAQATDEEIAEFNRLLAEAGETAANAYLASLGYTMDESNVGEDFAENTAEGLTNSAAATDAAEQMIVDMQEAASKKLTLYKALFVALGAQMVDGIVEGVENNKSKLINGIVDAAIEAYEAARDALDIHSPSKLFKRGIGKEIMVGWAGGIAENISLVVAEMKNATNAVVETAEGIKVPEIQVATRNYGEHAEAEVTQSHSGGGDTYHIYQSIQSDERSPYQQQQAAIAAVEAAKWAG